MLNVYGARVILAFVTEVLSQQGGWCKVGMRLIEWYGSSARLGHMTAMHGSDVSVL